MTKKRLHLDFLEDNRHYGAKYCDLESSQWGIGSNNPFAETHGSILMNEIVLAIQKHKGKVLDIGCGQGQMLSRVFQMVDEAIGIDISNTRVQQSKKRLRTGKAKSFSGIQADAEKLPFNYGCVDVVCAIENIQMMPNDRRVLQEINKTLKCDGVLVISTPNAWNFNRLSFFIISLLKGKLLRLSGEFPENFLVDQHVRFYNLFLLKARLAECGFIAKDIHGVGFRLPPTIYRRLPKSSLFIFAKTLSLLSRLLPIFSQTLLVIAEKKPCARCEGEVNL